MIDENSQMSESHRGKSGTIVFALMVFFVIASAGSAVYFYRQTKMLKVDPQDIVNKEVQTTLNQVGNLMILPEGEEPTIATVTDPERLKDQPFFANAKVGDRVLFYVNAKKAILYDPVANKIVEVAPLNVGNQ